jgi:hypothetical protein
MGELLMRAAAIVERRQALRNAGNGDINRGRFEPRKVYGGAPLYRPRKAKANPMPHLYFVLGALVFGGVMALADWMLRVQYGLGF